MIIAACRQRYLVLTLVVSTWVARCTKLIPQQIMCVLLASPENSSNEL
jgi:hypothetical protein